MVRERILTQTHAKNAMYPNTIIKICLIIFYIFYLKFTSFNYNIALNSRKFFTDSLKFNFTLFNYKYYKFFNMCKIVSKVPNHRLNSFSFYNFPTNSLLSIKTIFLKFYYIKLFSTYKPFFKSFFLRFKNCFYKNTYNNRLLFNLSYFNRRNGQKVFTHKVTHDYFKKLILKKKIYDVVLSNVKDPAKKKKLFLKYTPYLKKIKAKKPAERLKYRFKHNTVAKLYYTKYANRTRPRRLFSGNNFYLKGLNYFLR